MSEMNETEADTGLMPVYPTQPSLTHSVWTDFRYRNRTMSGLLRSLRSEVKSGRIVGWRMITVHTEQIGL